MTPQFYVVGGAVRDRLLGHPASDRDWVVVGATPEELLALGYKPVGRDFPVFLHPTTHEEVALARTERKAGPGYLGFAVHAAPGVTLEEDLQRRDLTINAIAQAEDGTLIDPFGGQRDIAAQVLRHVSPAFSEDPVRLLRLARLAARLPEFSVAPETEALCHDLVRSGEVDHLVPERVWQELSRGLMAQQPSRMLVVLNGCGALQRLLPELAGTDPSRLARRLDTAALLETPLPVRLACLSLDAGAAAARQLAQRWKLPTDCRELAELAAREVSAVHASAALDAAAVVQLFDRCDAWRRPERFAQLLLAAECDARAAPGSAMQPHAPGQRLPLLLAAAQAVDTAAVAAAAQARGERAQAIGQAVHAARVHAVEAAVRACDRPVVGPVAGSTSPPTRPAQPGHAA